MEKWDPDDNSVYYRIIADLDTGLPVVVTMQWFDEFDYDHDRYLTEERFEHEADAKRVADGLRAEAMLQLSQAEATSIKSSIERALILLGERASDQSLAPLRELLDKIEKKWES